MIKNIYFYLHIHTHAHILINIFHSFFFFFFSRFNLFIVHIYWRTVYSNGLFIVWNYLGWVVLINMPIEMMIVFKFKAIGHQFYLLFDGSQFPLEFCILYIVHYISILHLFHHYICTCYFSLRFCTWCNLRHFYYYHFFILIFYFIQYIIFYAFHFVH